MRYGSLFAGIGGIDLGLDRAGMECAWQVERDPYCLRVLEKHWPRVPKLEDVCDVGAHNLEPVDVVCGGFPCQDISYAGAGAGLAGDRSGLWWELARIVGEMGPRYVLLENVSALLTRGLGDVLGTLASLGYDAEWHCVPASAVGAPHRRDRVFIVAYAISRHARRRPGRPRLHAGDAARDRGEAVAYAPFSGLPKRVMHSGGGAVPDAEGGRCGPGREGRSAPGGPGKHKPIRSLPDPQRDGLEGVQQAGSTPGATDRPGDGCDPGWWATEPDVGRVAHGVPARVDRLRGLGNAVVPQVAQLVGEWIMDRERRMHDEA